MIYVMIFVLVTGVTMISNRSMLWVCHICFIVYTVVIVISLIRQTPSFIYYSTHVNTLTITIIFIFSNYL